MLVRRVRQALFSPSQQTHQIVKIHKLSIETAVVEIASKKCCIVLFYSYVMLSVLSLTKTITNGYKVSYTFCFFPQVDRTDKFASKMASLFRPVWRKKNPFLVTLYDSSSKIYTYMYISMHLFLHLSRGSIKKTCQASGKTLKSQGFCGPFPAPSFSAFKKKTRFRAETRTKTSVVVTSSTKSRPTSTYTLRYLNISGFGLVPKNTLTKFMVSWLLGRFVPESKPSCFFLHTGCTAFLFLKN